MDVLREVWRLKTVIVCLLTILQCRLGPAGCFFGLSLLGSFMGCSFLTGGLGWSPGRLTPLQSRWLLAGGGSVLLVWPRPPAHWTWLSHLMAALFQVGRKEAARPLRPCQKSHVTSATFCWSKQARILDRIQGVGNRLHLLIGGEENLFGTIVSTTTSQAVSRSVWVNLGCHKIL